MFVYSMRASTLKFFGVVCVALAVLIALIALVPTYDADATASETVSYTYDKIKSDDDVEKFLAQFGWQVGAEPHETADVTIPEEFDKIFAAYNEIQKRQGLDLSRYKRKDVKRYTYLIENYPDYEGKVYANLIVFRDRIVGADLTGEGERGFVKPLQ